MNIWTDEDRHHNLTILRRQAPWPFGRALPLKRNGALVNDPKRQTFATLIWTDGQLVLHEDAHLPVIVTPEEVIALGWVVD